MPLWPGALAAQLCLLLAAAVVAAQVMAFTVFASETSLVRRAAARTQVVDRVATLVRAIDAVPAASVDDVVTAFDTQRRQLTIGGTSLIPSAVMTSDEMRVARRLARRLGSSASDARIALVQRGPDERDDYTDFMRLQSSEALRVSVRLRDGRWLNGIELLRLPAVPVIRIGLELLGASLLAIFSVMAIAMRSITRPLSALANAADRVGRGESAAPFPISGPSEVKTTMKAFNLMQQRLTRFVSDRSRMLAAISHDMRTPIASLRLRAEMVEDLELRNAMVRTLADLQRITEATLSFAHNDIIVEETRETDLVALLEATVDDVCATGKEVALRVPERLIYRCRPTALRRAIGNLIENAARYGSRADVALQAEANAIWIIVDDDGPGLPADKLDDVFEAFVRIEPSRNDQTGGIGLGLAIARSAVRAHGGDIVLANRKGGGLRAKILLPFHDQLLIDG